MEISRREYWSGLPLPPPGDLPDPGIEPAAPSPAGGFLTTDPSGKRCTETGRSESAQEKRNCYPYSMTTTVLKKNHLWSTGIAVAELI